MTKWEDHEVFIDHVNEEMSKNNRRVVGVVTSQHEEDEDIHEIKIKIAPRSDDES